MTEEHRGGRLVDVNWLRGHLQGATVQVLDVRAVLPDLKTGYPFGHVPDALACDVRALSEMRHGIEGLLRPLPDLQVLLTGWGVRSEGTLVIYDESGGTLAGRMFWVLDYLGHPDVRLLDGGWDAWVASGGAVTIIPTRSPFSMFRPRLVPGRLIEIDELSRRLGEPGLAIVDTRSAAEYSAGHIPGAVHFPWDEAVQIRDNLERLRPAAELRDRFATLGVTPDKEVVVYCRSAMRSAHTYFVLRHLGYPNVRNYDGSWLEWEASRALAESATT